MENLKCSKCLRKYVKPRKPSGILVTQSVPILLKCGHTFCEKCVVRDSEIERCFKCPKCKVKTICDCDKIQVKDLYPNLAILGMLGMDPGALNLMNLRSLIQVIDKRKSQGTKRPTQQCSECVKDTAVMGCLQCGVGFCGHCFEITHQSPKALRLHQGIPLHHSEHDLSSLNCPKHNSLMEHFCIEDDKLICRECIGAEHAEHKIISLHEKSGEMSDQLLEAVQFAAPVMNQLKLLLSQIDEEVKDVKLEAQEKAEALMQQFLYIVGSVQATFLYLMVEIDKISTSHVKKLLTFRDAASGNLQKLQNSLSDANMIINVENSPEPVVINPFKTLANLMDANKIPCILKKIPNKTHEPAESESTEDSDAGERIFNDKKLLMQFHEDTIDATKNWGSIDNSCNFKYSIACPNVNDLKATSENDDTNSVSDTSSVLSENLIQIDIGAKQKIRIIQVPPANNQELVYVKWLKSPSEFYVQRAHDGKQISLIERTLMVFNTRPAKEEELLTSIRIGELCVGRFSGIWYRARVVKVFKATDVDDPDELLYDSVTAGEKDEVEIHYVDYGNNERTKVSRLRSLPKNLHRIPSLAILCSLAGIGPVSERGWSHEAHINFFKMVNSRPILMTTFAREAGQRFVDLHKPAPEEIDKDVPMSVRDALLFLNLAKYSTKQIPMSDVQLSNVKSVRSRDYLQPTVLMPRSYTSVTLSDFRSISRFFVQQLDDHAEYLESLTNKIQAFVKGKVKGKLDPAAPFTILFPYEGMICLAKYAHCSAWYRATILEVLREERKVKVVFVDYGNEDTVKLIDTLKIPDEFLKLPKQALECKLADIRPVGESKEWPSEADERFLDLGADNRSLLMYVRSVKDDCYSVELFDSSDYQQKSEDVLSINERLVYEGLAVGLTVRNITQFGGPTTLCKGVFCIQPYDLLEPDEKEKKETKNDEPNLLATPEVKSSLATIENGRLVVTITCADMPSEIYAQTVDQWDECNHLIRDMHRYFTSSEDAMLGENTWELGDLCAVYSNMEKRWCRGRVENKLPGNNFKVRLVDFGTREILSSNYLRPIPDQYLQVDALATVCSLKYIYPAGGSKEWTRTACEVLQEMILGKECDLACDEGELSKNPAQVELFITSAKDEINVSKELVMKGVALPRKMGMFRRAPNTGQVQNYFELADSSKNNKTEVKNHFQSSSRKSTSKHGRVRDSTRTEVSNRKPSKFKKLCISDLVDPSDENLNDNDAATANTNEVTFPRILSLNESFSSISEDSELLQAAEPDHVLTNATVVPNDTQRETLSSPISEFSAPVETFVEGVNSLDIFDVTEISDANLDASINSSGSYKRTSSPDDCQLKETPQTPTVHSDTSVSDIVLKSQDLDFHEPASSPEEVAPPVAEQQDHLKPVQQSCEPRQTEQSYYPENEFKQIPLSIGKAVLPDATSQFRCIVTHIERYNVVFVRQVPANEFCPDDNDVKYLTPLDDLRPGSPCVAQFTDDDRWYRAEIVKHYKGQDLAKVLYVDYGLVEVLPVHDRLRTLTNEYCRHPAQAIRCRLNGMPHPKDMFLPENAVMNTLAALIGQQVLECYVTEVYEKYGKPPSIGVELRTVDGEKTTLIVDQVLAALHVTL